MFRVISIALLLLDTGVFPSFAAAGNPGKIELAENWKLASATDAQSDGTAISVAGYKDARWHIAFFGRAAISSNRDGDEILPIEYDDNYVTIYPGETAEIHGTIWNGAKPRWVKLEGYNTPAISVPIK